MSDMMRLNLPARHNKRLSQLVARLDRDVELHTL